MGSRASRSWSGRPTGLVVAGAGIARSLVVAVFVFGVVVVVGVGGTAVLSARQRPRISPHEIHEFDAGGCHVTFNYGRPSKRGRQIWGGLVPWGHWWMPGADEATIVTTSKAITLEGLAVPAGSHTLYMLPDASASELVVSNEVGQFHTQYHPDRNLGQVRLALKHLDAPLGPVEEMTFTVEPEASGGRLTLSWDDRAYSAGFVVR
jgi:hypothetical protein